jgi:hypothetical protein
MKVRGNTQEGNQDQNGNNSLANMSHRKDNRKKVIGGDAVGREVDGGALLTDDPHKAETSSKQEVNI